METWIYLASVSNLLGMLLSVVGIVGAIVSIVLWVRSYEDYCDEDSNEGAHVPRAKYAFITCCTAALLSCFVPSKDTVYAMMAVHYGQEVVNNERVTNITNNSLDLLDAWIDKEREKLKEREK